LQLKVATDDQTECCNGRGLHFDRVVSMLTCLKKATRYGYIIFKSNVLLSLLLTFRYNSIRAGLTARLQRLLP